MRTVFKVIGRLMTLARWLLVPYIAGVLFWAFGTFLMAGYGLAHASEGAIGAFFLLITAVGLIGILLPLSLLSRSTHPFWRVLRALGLVVMMAFSASILQLVWQILLEPRLMIMRFNATMAKLEPGAMREEPLNLGGHLAGVRVMVDVRLTQAVPMDERGALVLDAMQSLSLTAADPKDGSVALTKLPFQADVTYEGKPLTSVPGFAHATQSGVTWPPPTATLPAGNYRLQAQFWFSGIADVGGDGQLCREETLDKDQWHSELVAHLGSALRPAIGTRLALKYRLGYRGYHYQWPTLAFRGDELAWRKAFNNLPLATCAERQRLKEQEALARERQAAEQRFEAGDVTLPTGLNPLYLAMCAGDREETRRRLAAPIVARLDLVPLLVDCTIKRTDPALFAMVLPRLYERTGPNGDYCSLLFNVYTARSVELLKTLAELKLPLACSGSYAQSWRSPFEVRDEQGNPPNLVWDDKMHDWLAYLLKEHVPVCAHHMNGSLLTDAMLKAPAATLTMLLDAGCDANEYGISVKLAELTKGEAGGASPNQLWALRRRLQGRFGIAPMTAEEVEAVGRRLPPLDDGAYTAMAQGGSFAFRVRRLLVADAELFRYFLDNGLAIDFADGANCESPYPPGYQPTDPAATDLPEKALLDRLSTAELEKLIKPWAFNCTPKPMPEVHNFAANGLGTYLCQRGIVACPPG